MSLLKRKNKEIKVKIYSKSDCHLCDEAKSVLLKVQQEIPFDFFEVDITSSRELFTEYKEQIPVVFINNQESFRYRVNEKELRKRLLASSC